MRFEIGKHANDDWKILDDDGNDITKLLAVTRFELKVEASEQTKVEIEAYNEHTRVDVLPEGVTVNLIPLDPRSPREKALEEAAADVSDWLRDDNSPGAPQARKRLEGALALPIFRPEEADAGSGAP